MFERAIGVPGQAQDLRGRRVVLVPTVGAWRETSTDLGLLVELIAHSLADEETGTTQVAHHQSVARQKCNPVADFGTQMHLAWAQHLWDNREFVKMRAATRALARGSGRVMCPTTATRRRPVPERPAHGCWAQSPRRPIQPTGVVRSIWPNQIRLPSH